MMFKIIGGAMVILAGGLLGIAASNKYAGRPRELKALRISLQMLETEIVYGATPLPYAFQSIADKTNELWTHFYRQLSEYLLTGSFYTLKDAWNETVDKKLEGTCLNKADIELIRSFGNILGASDREDQQKHFKLYYKQLEQQESIAEEDKVRNEKMYKSLGFMLGITVFIVLV